MTDKVSSLPYLRYELKELMKKANNPVYADEFEQLMSMIKYYEYLIKLNS